MTAPFVDDADVGDGSGIDADFNQVLIRVEEID
ncbi:hypothetical protein AERO9A_250085 [Aeromonas salmonicida]|nr:hypothetical protein AERO9A_250085 [Aeromonas salmonicida]